MKGKIMSTNHYEHRKSYNESFLKMIHHLDYEYQDNCSLIAMIMEEDMLQDRMKRIISFGEDTTELEEEFLVLDERVTILRDKIKNRLEQLYFSI